MKKVFINELQRYTNGRYKNKINWINSINKDVDFIYNDIYGKVKIINYSNNKLTLQYKEEIYYITTDGFKACQFGKILEKYTSNFKIEIGTRFQDYKRNIIIIDKKRIGKWKYYKYECYTCGFDGGKHYSNKDNKFKDELWIEESNILKGVGCSCCNGGNQIVVEGINDIPTTAPWLIPYFQGGYDEAKLYIKNSNKKINPICPDCGRVKDKLIRIQDIYKQYGISCMCKDRKYFPEKCLFNILEQLGLNFTTQLSKTTFNWCYKYRYDFYFEDNNEQYICEVNGRQHYEQTKGSNWDKLEKTQLNDRIKKELALANGIKEENYIIIDCRKSEIDWIKDNENGILNSRLSELFDLSKIDWSKCGEFANSNLVKSICEIKNKNSQLTTRDIGKIYKIDRHTVCEYLKKGSKIWDWCDYNSKKEQKQIVSKNGKENGIPIIILKNNICIGMSFSAHQLERKSEELFGVKLYNSNVCRVCNNKTPQYKGYIFKYIKDLTSDEYIKYDIENKLKELYNRELVQAV